MLPTLEYVDRMTSCASGEKRWSPTCDQAGKKKAGAATDRALAAEGRTAQAGAETSTLLPWAHGIETEVFTGDIGRDGIGARQLGVA
jgi:hypothetical protein